MNSNRIRSYLLLLLAMLLLMSCVMSVGQTQARYNDTVVLNTVLPNEGNAVSSNCLVSEGEQIILLGELPPEGDEITFTLETVRDIASTLSWSVNQANYLDVSMELVINEGEGTLDQSNTLELFQGTKATIRMKLTPTQAALETSHDALEINVAVAWGDMKGTFRTTLPAVVLEEPTEPPTEAPTDPSEPTVDNDDTQTDPPVQTEPGTDDTQTGSGSTDNNTPGSTETTGATESTQSTEATETTGSTETTEATGDPAQPAALSEEAAEETTLPTQAAETVPETTAEQTEAIADVPSVIAEDVTETTAATTQPTTAPTTEATTEATTEPTTGPTSAPTTEAPTETETTASTENTTSPVPSETETEPTGGADTESTDPTDPTVPPEEGDEETAKLEMETITNFDPAVSLPVLLKPTGNADSILLGLGIAEDAQTTMSPFPAFMRYHVDGADYLLYHGGVIEVSTASNARQVILLDFSDVTLADTELMLTAQEYLAGVPADACTVSAKADVDISGLEETRFLVREVSSADAEETSFTVELPDEWIMTHLDFDYSVQRMCVEGSAVTYKDVSLSDEILFAEYARDSESGEHTLTISFREENPPAGTYRLNMNWSYYDVCFREIQTTFFINYSGNLEFS